MVKTDKSELPEVAREMAFESETKIPAAWELGEDPTAVFAGKDDGLLVTSGAKNDDPPVNIEDITLPDAETPTDVAIEAAEMFIALEPRELVPPLYVELKITALESWGMEGMALGRDDKD